MVILHTLRRKYMLWSHVIRTLWDDMRGAHARSMPTQEMRVQVAEDSFVASVYKAFEARKRVMPELIADKDIEIQQLTATIEGIRALEIKTEELLKKGGKAQEDRARKYGERRQLQALLRECSLPFEAALRMQYHELRAIPRVKAFWIEGTNLVIETEPLYGIRLGVWRRIGPFLSCFDIVHPLITNFGWKNLDGPRGTHEGPPNIVSSGDGWGRLNCPGPAGLAFIRGARANRDYTTLVSFAVRYPECSGREGNETMDKWPVVELSEVPPWYRERFGT